MGPVQHVTHCAGPGRAVNQQIHLPQLLCLHLIQYALQKLAFSNMFLVLQGQFGDRPLPRLRLVQCFITPFRLGLNWPCYLNVYYLPLPVRESLTGEILWLLLNSDMSTGWQGACRTLVKWPRS